MICARNISPLPTVENPLYGMQSVILVKTEHPWGNEMINISGENVDQLMVEEKFCDFI